MNILVTGLPLAGNKGGAAMALSLRAQLSKYIHNPKFCYCVPAGAHYKHEQNWAEKFGVRVVRRTRPKDHVFPWCLVSDRKERRQELAKEFKRSDVVIDLSALTYNGLWNWMSSLYQYQWFYLAKKHNKPFLRWTQSYGPFTGMINRYLAKKDLSHQEVVFCRGDITKETVEKLLPGKKVFSFPDVATVLPYSKSDGIEHLKYKYGLAEKFVSISASSKMYAQPENNRRLTKSYQDVVVNLCDYVSNEHDLSILMVPYSISPNNSNPKRNDLALAKLVASNCKASLAVIEEDLSPSLLKSIIAASHIHVGARYHSVVAALSSGVPCVSIAWHVKYKEIMAMYGMESLTWHFRQDRVEKLYASVSQVIEHASTIRAHLERKQKNIQNLVEENTREFIKVLNKALKG